MNIINFLSKIRRYFIFIFQDIFKNKKINVNNINENGFVYIFNSQKYLSECILSIKSLKKFHNEKIAVFSDKRFKDKFNDLVDIFVPIDISVIRPKVKFLSNSPFKNTIYLDTDTFITRSISDLFELSVKFDLAAVYCHSRKREFYSKKIKKYKSIPYSFPELNSGVIFYKQSKKTKNFFKLWEEYYKKFFIFTSGWDQPSFRVALWESKIQIHVLPVEYNVRPIKILNKISKMKNKLGTDHMEPRIFHMHLNDNNIIKNSKKSFDTKRTEYEKKHIKISY
jgi:hypothetical protein